ncbi:myotrophin-like [Leptopilina heterotoma]|uniref:myotrophin-like n=1 Tax=Leptopilina heterotoma TaxID=63436 RepID=UPI001CA7CA8D|nr:myotrophin-like [Leptopilina heterotoma]
MNELVWGIKNGDLDQVRDIVENKDMDVNKLINGRTLLHYAADYGQSDVLGYLLEKGADANARDKHGITTLLAAIWEGHTNCVKLLLEKGARPNGVTPDGTSYLDAAEKEEIKELLELYKTKTL